MQLLCSTSKLRKAVHDLAHFAYDSNVPDRELYFSFAGCESLVSGIGELCTMIIQTHPQYPRAHSYAIIPIYKSGVTPIGTELSKIGFKVALNNIIPLPFTGGDDFTMFEIDDSFITLTTNGSKYKIKIDKIEPFNTRTFRPSIAKFNGTDIEQLQKMLSFAADKLSCIGVHDWTSYAYFDFDVESFTYNAYVTDRTTLAIKRLPITDYNTETANKIPSSFFIPIRIAAAFFKNIEVDVGFSVRKNKKYTDICFNDGMINYRTIVRSAACKDVPKSQIKELIESAIAAINNHSIELPYVESRRLAGILSTGFLPNKTAKLEYSDRLALTIQSQEDEVSGTIGFDAQSRTHQFSHILQPYDFYAALMYMMDDRILLAPIDSHKSIALYSTNKDVYCVVASSSKNS